MEQENKLQALHSKIETLYASHKKEMLFHGWHHVAFVSKKAKEFGSLMGANIFMCESAALVHDLNYLVKVNSSPEEGTTLRMSILTECGYTKEQKDQIERIIFESHTATRGSKISLESMAVSDADTLFKSLPITPILFASKYIQENKVDIEQLAQKIVQEQKPLFEEGIYFYSEYAKERYLHWAQSNLSLWENVHESLKDGDVQELLSLARQQGVL